ncbi:MAG: glutaminyl-peptide cyclotransferase [Alistipes sp.]|jgi:glutamine cyclotransferase|nr:glutaminyl-peptide cyclotransferase [Alistipes sp.]
MKIAITTLLCAAGLAACVAACGNKPVSTAIYGYTIVDTHPHDPEAYTQGLFWHEGALVESTGEYGYSTLRRVDLATGEVTRRIDLSGDVFAEGAALIDGKIYQLTWYEQRCFVYDATTFDLLREFDYRETEGWGLTTDGENLYMSDGTANIYVRDPATFEVVRTVVVRRDGRPVQFLNEMEWIDGKIWANVYGSMEVVIFDPATGNVEGVVDFAGIERMIDITPMTDVMNGIAHDPATGRVFVTGKNWNRLFEIEIIKR